MKKLITLLAMIMVSQAALAAPVTSYFPRERLGELLARHFDLATIRSSLGPKRSPGANTFALLGITPSTTDNISAVFDTEIWYYSITVLRRGDINKDGIEDLELCFVDRVKQKYHGYNSQQALLVSRYTPDGNIVALAYSVTGCETFHR
jgi:hypothetical protein